MKHLLALCLAGLIPATAAIAQDVNGRETYLENCAGCHGEVALGDGPLAALISVEMPDLTVLSRRYGGIFPLVDVVRQIDGRVEMRGHGGPMPVFGAMLGGASAVIDTAAGDPVVTKAAVLAVADYLESLQR
ncbi:c-type cytochrome [Profundibacter sp.]